MKVLRCHWRPGQANYSPDLNAFFVAINLLGEGPGRLIFTPECIRDVTELTSQPPPYLRYCLPVMLKCAVSPGLLPHTRNVIVCAAFPDNI